MRKKRLLAVVFAYAATGAFCKTEAWSASPATPFYWGVANAAFQVEGSPADSNWRAWTQTPGRIADGTNAERATDFWNRYSEDFDLASQLGSNAFRMSIAWERIRPQDGREDREALRHYGEIILAMRARGLEPFVTLQHFALPLWLAQEGGYLSPRFKDAFADYAESVVQFLSAPPYNVRFWMTFNEPTIVAFMSYVEGRWPPGRKGDFNGALNACAQMVRGHLAALTRIRKNVPNGADLQFGFAHHMIDAQPAASWNPVDRLLTERFDDVANEQFVTALRTGKIRFGLGVGPKVEDDVPLPPGKPLDFYGVNYYGRALIGLSLTPPFFHRYTGNKGAHSDLDWEIYPEGLGHVLAKAARHGLPILISENGVADAADRYRPDFLRDHLAEVRKARAAGIPVFGYLHWSLTDNFEWADGLKPRFGLVEIDYATGARRPRASFNLYRELIQKGIDR